MGRRHEEHEEHENHEAWVIPYADMLTLLMGLFLVMWSIGSTDLAKLKKVGQGFASEIGSITSPATPGGSGTAPEDPSGAIPDFPITPGANLPSTLGEATSDIAAENALLTSVQANLETLIASLGVSGASVRRDSRGVVVVLTDELLFASGSTDLNPAAKSVLASIAEPLRSNSQPISIEGHTDNQPPSGLFPTNWELSTARATAVLRQLVEGLGLSARRVSATGFADTVPVADNSTVEGRARNRRVEILVAAPVSGTFTEAGSTTATTAPIPAFDPIGDPLASPTTSKGG